MFRPLRMICCVDSLRIRTLQLHSSHVSEHENYNGNDFVVPRCHRRAVHTLMRRRGQIFPGLAQISAGFVTFPMFKGEDRMTAVVSTPTPFYD